MSPGPAKVSPARCGLAALSPHRSPRVSPHGAAYLPGRRKAHLMGPVALKSLQSTVGELHVEHRHPAAVAHAPTRQPVTPSLLQRRHLATITPPPPSSATAPAPPRPGLARPAPARPPARRRAALFMRPAWPRPTPGTRAFFDQAEGRLPAAHTDGHAPEYPRARPRVLGRQV